MRVSGRSLSGMFARMERLEQRALYSASALSSAALTALSEMGLPDLPNYSAPSSHPALPAGADSFAPPVKSQALANGVPVIATRNATANSGDTLTLTGSSFTNDTADDYADTREIVYGQTSATNGTLSYAAVESGGSTGVLATISASEPGDSMYLVWPENSSGIGAPVAVNQTDAQWMNSASAAPSSTVSVYGRNLDNGAGESWVYLQPSTGAGQWAVVTSANAYRVQFTLPADFTPGSNYQVWVYNGHGGNYGWSTPLNLTVSSPTVWSTTVNVKSFGATGNGTTDDGRAIQTALHSLAAGQTLFFPAGTYVVDGEQLLLPSNVRIEGAGPDASSLEFEGAVPNFGVGEFDIGVRDFDGAHNIDFESIGLTYNGPRVADASMVRERYATDMTFNNVRLQSNCINSIDWESGVGLTLTNSTVIANEFYVNASDDVVLDGDSFLQAYDTYGQAAMTFDKVQDTSITNCTTENYYDYELSINPNTPYDAEGFGEGRFMEFAYSAANVYVAGNESINLGESQTPADNNSGEQINVEGTQDMVHAPIASAASNSFTVAGQQNTSVTGLDAVLTDGSGIGQQFVVTGSSYNPATNTTTYTIDGNFAVIPQPGDDIDIALAPTNMVFYQNTLNHTTGALADQDHASTGIEFYSGGSGIVIDDNTVNNTRTGINLANSNANFPLDSAYIANNTFNGVQTGMLLSRNPSPAPNFVGVVIQANSMLGMSTSYLAVGPGIAVSYDGGGAVQNSLTVVEFNTVRGFAAGLEAGDNLGTLVCQNSFVMGTNTQTNLGGIHFDSQTSSLVLQGNSYMGYAAAYSGYVPQSLGLPSFSAAEDTFYDFQTMTVTPSIITTVTNPTPDPTTPPSGDDGNGGSNFSTGSSSTGDSSTGDSSTGNSSTDNSSADNSSGGNSSGDVQPPAANDPSSGAPDSPPATPAAVPAAPDRTQSSTNPHAPPTSTRVQYTDYGNTILNVTIASPTATKIHFTTLKNGPATTAESNTAGSKAAAKNQNQTAPVAAHGFDGTMAPATFWSPVDDERAGKKNQLSLIGQIESDLE